MTRLSAPLAAAIAAFLLVAPGAEAQRATHALRGRAVDSAGAPLPGVRVALLGMGRTGQTGADGAFRFTALPAGEYTLSLVRIGLAPQTRRVALAGADLVVEIGMRAARVELAGVQVTATTAATRAQDSPQPVSVLEGPALRVAQGAALGETLELIPGVRSLSMTSGIGKPVIRGMTHYRIVTLDNGQRTETQAWGHDHSPNVETAAAERVEVIKGPASVLYGSDALGGVVNVIAPPVPDAIDVAPFARGRVLGGYNSNTRGTDGTLELQGARGGFGARVALTRRASGDMRTPDRALTNTDNRAVAPEVAVGHRGAWGSLQARLVSRDERIEIFDDPVKSPGYTGFQRIATRRGSLEAATALGRSRLQANLGWERNDRREYAADTSTSADLGLLVNNWTGFAHLHHPTVGRFSGTLGVSGMTSDFLNQGTKTLIPSSGTRNAAVYAFEQVELGRLRATVGARYDWRTLATDGHEGIGVPAQRRRFDAVTGSVGLLYRVAEPVAVVASVARGFRAPAAPDLFANGFHEGTRAFERGDPDLDVETSLNTEIGLRITRSDLSAEATAYVNRVRDYIYLRPFGASGGAFDSLQVVQGDARLVGMEARAAYRPLDALTLQLSGDMVRGTNTAADVPLTFIPPPRVVYGARLEGEAFGGRRLRDAYVSVTGETNWRQTRLDPRDVGPRGYTLATLSAGTTRLVPRGPWSIDLTVRNALDVRYRSFMSRYKEYAHAAGRTLVLKVAAPF